MNSDPRRKPSYRFFISTVWPVSLQYRSDFALVQAKPLIRLYAPAARDILRVMTWPAHIK
jgi:hypothetical protein